MKVPHRKNRGSVLILSSLFTFFTLLAAITLFKVLPMEFNAAKKSRVDVNAHYALDAGVKDAVAWLESRPSGQRLTQDSLDEFNDEFGGPNDMGGNWAYTVRMERLEEGHVGITSAAFFRQSMVREAKAQVVYESLGRYALFIDTWPLQNNNGQAGLGSLIYSINESLVTGPFHTNDFFVLVSEGFEGSTPAQAFVSGPYAEMTHARSTSILGEDIENFVADGNAYLNRSAAINQTAPFVPFDEDGALEDRYQRVVEGGRGNLRKVEHIDFPNTAVDRDGIELREKARGIGNLQFNEQGILELRPYVATNDDGDVLGGVYVVGDSEIRLSVDGNGNAVQTIAQEHREEAYFEAVERQIESPRLIRTTTDTPPEFLEEVVIDMVPQRVIVGYEEPTVAAGDGITQPVRIPIYEVRDVPVERIVQVPFEDVENPPPPPYVVFVVDTENPIVYDTIVLNPISEEEYNPENPAHTVQLQEAGDREYQIVEVSSQAGYQLPQGATVEGVITGGTVPKDHTVFIDRMENTIVVSRGNLNGVTFVDGNILALSGVNKGAVTASASGLEKFAGRTIVAAPEFGKSLTIDGNLLQFFDQGGDKQGPGSTLRAGELPPNADHALGLVARNVNLSPEFQTSQARPQELYAVILAGWGARDEQGRPLPLNGRQRTVGGFGTVAEILSGEIPFALGRFRLVGGIIEAEARPWFIGQRGLEGELRYDPAAAAALTNFPSINSVKVVRYSEYFAN